VESALATNPQPTPGRRIEIPVVYDGADLAEVAELAQLSSEEVVERHAAAEYVAAFIGFAPGFAYLIGGDERLHVPRRAHPRKRVPAGSVAIGGPYSGVYPRDTPGGWRLLGRTTVSLFDATREQPALLASGDRVRFVRL
jgi:KipI family sensor histidine kinase inhibitor